MTKPRELYCIKNDHPERLTVFIGYKVDKDKLTFSTVKAVQRDKFTMINLSNGELLTIGSVFYFDPTDVITQLLQLHQHEIDKLGREYQACLDAHAKRMEDIKDFAAKLKLAKLEEKKNAGRV